MSTCTSEYRLAAAAAVGVSFFFFMLVAVAVVVVCGIQVTGYLCPFFCSV